MLLVACTADAGLRLAKAQLKHRGQLMLDLRLHLLPALRIISQENLAAHIGTCRADVCCADHCAWPAVRMTPDVT